MDRFDYKIPAGIEYKSSGITPGPIKRPVAWGSKTSFVTPLSTQVGRGVAQVVVEPAVDETIILTLDDIIVRYLQNGVYTVGDSRIVTATGPTSIKVIISDSEVFVLVGGVTVQINKVVTSATLTISPNSDVMYDKFVYNYEVSVDELVKKPINQIRTELGTLTPLIRDKWYDPQLIQAEDMVTVDDYKVSTRRLALTNTAAAFYSDVSLIEKSIDGEEWEPVDKVEYHGEDSIIFRSKDPDFTLRYYDTNMTEFILPGAVTTIEGSVYKVGNDIGSLFSHDCYRIHNGRITFQSDEMRSVTVLGYLSDAAIAALNPIIDYNGTNYGKMHLYTFDSGTSFTLEDEEMFFAGVGFNLDHEEVMDRLCGISEISYADEIEPLQLGQSINGENEYAILDLQWNV